MSGRDRLFSKIDILSLEIAYKIATYLLIILTTIYILYMYTVSVDIKLLNPGYETI
jgi:hypothetical protein